MATDTHSTPLQGPFKPASAPTTAQALTAARASQQVIRPQQNSTPMALDLVELELALDISDLTDRGFCDAVRDAAAKINGEFLFDLPASGLVDDAQRIALVCLSRDNGGRFGLVLLSADGDRFRTAEADEATQGLVRFARAFVSVLEKL